MVLVLLAPSTVALGQNFPPRENPKLDRALQQVLNNRADRHVPVIIQTVPGGLPAVRRALAARGRPITGEFRNIRALGATVDLADLALLVANPAVAAVSMDAPVRAHALTGTDAFMTLDLVRADLGSVSKGVTGNNVGIAIIDSGISGGLPDAHRRDDRKQRPAELLPVAGHRAESSFDRSQGSGQERRRLDEHRSRSAAVCHRQ
jgi:hypothetical protein